MKKNKKSPRASKGHKSKKKYEEKLFVWFTISILLLVIIALVIFIISKIDIRSKDEVLAVVNGEKITATALDNWYKISVNPEFRNAVKKEDFLAESLIPQLVLLQEAEKNRVEADEEEVDAALGEFLIDSGQSLRDFEKKLKQDGASLDYVKEAFRQRLIIDKFLNQTILSKIEVSDFEVNEILKDTKSFDPTLSSEEIRQAIRGQLIKRKQIEALKVYTHQLLNRAEVELFIGNGEIRSFSETKDEICREDGKPVVRLYSTSYCSHCEWIKSRFDSVMEEYIWEDKIIAYHWELDTGDNTLTKQKEKGVPKGEIEIFKKYNKEGTVPTYVFGCKYLRAGNFYEGENDLDAEEKEFRAAIEKLLRS